MPDARLRDVHYEVLDSDREDRKEERQTLMTRDMRLVEKTQATPTGPVQYTLVLIDPFQAGTRVVLPVTKEDWDAASLNTHYDVAIAPKVTT